MVQTKITFSKADVIPPVFVAGDFTQWNPSEMENKSTTGEFGQTQYSYFKSFDVPAGDHQYKFRLGLGDWWVLDESKPTIRDFSGNTNNVVTVKPEEHKIEAQPDNDFTPLAPKESEPVSETTANDLDATATESPKTDDVSSIRVGDAEVESQATPVTLEKPGTTSKAGTATTNEAVTKPVETSDSPNIKAETPTGETEVTAPTTNETETTRETKVTQPTTDETETTSEATTTTSNGDVPEHVKPADVSDVKPDNPEVKSESKAATVDTNGTVPKPVTVAAVQEKVKTASEQIQASLPLNGSIKKSQEPNKDAPPPKGKDPATAKSKESPTSKQSGVSRILSAITPGHGVAIAGVVVLVSLYLNWSK